MPAEAPAASAKTATPKTLLIADDEPHIRRVLQAIFVKDGYEVQVAENGVKALEWASQNPVSLLITDLIMPDMNGVELIQKVKQKHPDSVAIVITAYATIKTCVDAMRYGASDYITKPFDMDEIRAVVKRAVARAAEAQSPSGSASKSSGKPPSILANAVSPAMQDVVTTIGRAASSRATVLIRGESGTGKELVARALHEQSDRAGGPFVPISCAALSETLLESELFGHEKNAFTGAAAERKGRFELAHGGTLFLDEIGDVSGAVQVKLLRVLQQREFERVGGTKTIKVDVRVVAATNADLEQQLKDGKFREDLYYRLKVLEITMPRLKERRDDIPLLANLFLQKFNEENGTAVEQFSPEAMLHLQSYAWPGNVRELENVVHRCVVMADHNVTVIEADMLPAIVREGRL